MTYITKILCSIILFMLMNVQIYGQSQQEGTQPNIILIMADDLGYGDIGSYNNEIDFTPNIDRLAKEGMRFTDFHSNGPMCSPTRASLLTGMYQQRLGERFESALSPRVWEEGLPLDAITIAELLRGAGYKTGMFGKWHLGFEEPYVPNNYGFDEFRGHLSGDGDYHTKINRWGRQDWWFNEDLDLGEEGYNTDLITDYSINFIEKHNNEPFFLYIPYLAIHFPWQGPDDPPHREAGLMYGDNKWGIVEDEGNVRPHVISMLKSLDDNVGRIMKKLQELSLENETLVIFTSDNGGYTHYYQYGYRFENISDNGPLRGQKTDVYEGGHRVPFIAYWPERIEGGTVSDETVMTMDLFPTFSELAGIELPNDYYIDGINILPTLLENKSLPERTLYWKIGNRWATRKGSWKLVQENDGNKYLFNLKNDISETTDLSVKHPLIVKELNYLFQVWYQEVSLDANKWN